MHFCLGNLRIAGDNGFFFKDFVPLGTNTKNKYISAHMDAVPLMNHGCPLRVKFREICFNLRLEVAATHPLALCL